MRAGAVSVQEEQRQRRRHRQRVHYGAEFDLAAEVEAVCNPLGPRSAPFSGSGTCRRLVDELVAAVHECVTVVGSWLADDARTGGVAVVAAPQCPVVDDEALAAGSWPKTLAELARPYSKPLGVLLGRSLPADHNDLRGGPSRSERLEKLLRETVDTRARELARYLQHRETHPVRVPPSQRVYSQEELRSRRRHRQAVIYDGANFDLVAELTGICGPIAERFALLGPTSTVPLPITELAAAAHTLVCRVADLLTEDREAARIAHVHHPADREKAVRALAAFEDRPKPPALLPVEVNGAWAELLADMARPYCVPLAQLLGRSLPPEDDRLGGAASVSERLVEALRETVDRAALSCVRWLARKEATRPRRAPDPYDEHRATLAALDVRI